ncbi:hypothetical protein GE118_02075 [Mycoplasma sp. NEAQ87857]|uniref:SWIM zinc finger family protein n=1 Tax=Mycoplasma sp. NEAQ87857 TaxID=2683967 RepID=UPI00131922D2|nr:SWIM zinc finger family protein [Mycoplasma sp. NEAQ87857]QGZ97582.1 hypothetical protein GE118_02075 [Mycoplasma sp. NEAQ87857]
MITKKEKVRIPIVVESRRIITSWSAIEWINSLKTSYYYDEKRFTRARTYMRKGKVIHFELKAGEIFARVSGNARWPYKILITIPTLEQDKIDQIKHLISENINSLVELEEGKFNDTFSKELYDPKLGFLPQLDDMRVKCSCPDWTILCKHVIAVFYGLGVKLDTEPLAFFELRGIKTKDLLKESVDTAIKNIVKKKVQKSNRIISIDKAKEIFNI